MMAPEAFGWYALITSLSVWFMSFSTLGSTQVICRFVAQLMEAGQQEPLTKFLGNLLTLHLGSGLLAAAFYLILTVFWLHDLGLITLASIASAIWVRAVAASGRLGMVSADPWPRG